MIDVATAATDADRRERSRSQGTLTSANDSPETIGAAWPIFLRHGSPRILLTAAAASLAARVVIGDWSAWDLVPLLAIAALWPVQEWLIHVYILHFRPVQVFGRTIDFPVPKSHRRHHRDPWNYDILFIPIHSFLYTLPVLIGLWCAFAPSLALAFTGISVHLLLSLHYEWIHFLIHTRVQPRTRFYQHLWRNHRLHHFKSEHYWYGVTRTEGDWLLGTAPEAKRVGTSTTCRELLGQAPRPA
ncbi:MAG TPA: sterol desaturase family protein [Terriglobales bacterium]|nr:sterol desaturase family protein [Terriglobales bacterium]